MDVRQAHAFLALAEELHFGRAAQRLHMTQPQLSRLIRQLEADLEVALFERTTRSVELTPQAESLLDLAREFVELPVRMKEVVRRVTAGETGRVRLGFSGASVNHLVGELARNLRRERMGLSIELHSSQLSHPGLDRLLDGSIDALIGRWDFLPDDVASRVIAREQLVVAVPADHRLARIGDVAAADVAREPWIALPGGSGATLSNRLHLLGRRGGFVPRVVQTVPDSETQLLLVGAGTGVALVFSGVRDNLPATNVAYLPVPELGTVDIRIAWLRDAVNPALDATLEVARRTFLPAG